jgi:transposase
MFAIPRPVPRMYQPFSANHRPLSHRTSPPRLWQPMTDDEWLALLPYVLRRSGPGRPIPELRARIDAIFHIGSARQPWHRLPAAFGKPDTVARYYRRLTHAGLWQKLLCALATTPPDHPLRRLEPWIVRAARRAYRIVGLALIVLVRRLGLHSALPAPPWLLPDPDLSETILFWPFQVPDPWTRPNIRRLRTRLGLMLRILRTAGGRKRISRAMRLAWP